MNLVDDYLRAVAILLPRSERDDIVAELRDMILSRLEARASELGRQPTNDEIEATLRTIGHPLVVAARYRGGPQHVVGPALYPYWSFAVKMAVGLQIAVAGVVFLVRSLSGGDIARAFGLAVGAGLSGAITMIGLATAAAWLIERNGVAIGYLDRWRVRDLRFLDLAAWDLEALRETASHSFVATTADRTQWPRGRRHRQRGLASRGLSLVAGGAVLIFWCLGIPPIELVGGPADLRDLGLDPGPLAATDWRALATMLRLPCLAYGSALLLLGLLILTRPWAVRLRGFVDFAIGAGVALTTFWIWTSSPLADAVRVNSLTGLAIRVKAVFESGPPVDLAPFLTLILAACAFGAVGRMGKGLAEILSPGETRTERHAGI